MRPATALEVDRAPHPDASSGSILIEPLASSGGDREAGWLFRHAPNRAFVGQGIKRIGQGTVGQAGSRRCLKLLERHTGFAVLGG